MRYFVLFVFLIILTNIPIDEIILRPIPFEVLSGAPTHSFIYSLFIEHLVCARNFSIKKKVINGRHKTPYPSKIYIHLREIRH